MALKIELKAITRGGAEVVIKNIMDKEGLQFPLQVTADKNTSLRLPILEIMDGRFKGWAASNFKFEVIKK